MWLQRSSAFMGTLTDTWRIIKILCVFSSQTLLFIFLMRLSRGLLILLDGSQFSYISPPVYSWDVIARFLLGLRVYCTAFIFMDLLLWLPASVIADEFSQDGFSSVYLVLFLKSIKGDDPVHFCLWLGFLLQLLLQKTETADRESAGKTCIQVRVRVHVMMQEMEDILNFTRWRMLIDCAALKLQDYISTEPPGASG